jgi:hypothetical protein
MVNCFICKPSDTVDPYLEKKQLKERVRGVVDKLVAQNELPEREKDVVVESLYLEAIRQQMNTEKKMKDLWNLYYRLYKEKNGALPNLGGSTT